MASRLSESAGRIPATAYSVELPLAPKKVPAASPTEDHGGENLSIGRTAHTNNRYEFRHRCASVSV